jgi:hypothetical protein
MPTIMTSTKQPDVRAGSDHRATIISTIHITDAACKSHHERNGEAELESIEPRHAVAFRARLNYWFRFHK